MTLNDEVSFANAINVSNREGYRIQGKKGLMTLYNLLEHLSEGGTINNFYGLSSEQAVTLLGVAWLDVSEITKQRSQ